jgi:hypothetical protein
MDLAAVRATAIATKGHMSGGTGPRPGKICCAREKNQCCGERQDQFRHYHVLRGGRYRTLVACFGCAKLPARIGIRLAISDDPAQTGLPAMAV